MSIDTLLRDAPMNHHGAKGYLWTFTLVWTAPLSEGCKAWSKAAKALCAVLDFKGVRVFEMHPGVDGVRSHGLHVHCVCARRYKARDVRAVISRFGWNCHVAAIRKSAHYVTKYLHKAVRAVCLSGRRLWAAVGMPKRKGNVIPSGSATRARDLELHSVRAAAFAIARRQEASKVREDAKGFGKLCYGRIRAKATALVAAFYEIAGMPRDNAAQPTKEGARLNVEDPNLDNTGTIFDGRVLWPVEWRKKVEDPMPVVPVVEPNWIQGELCWSV